VIVLKTSLVVVNIQRASGRGRLCGAGRGPTQKLFSAAMHANCIGLLASQFDYVTSWVTVNMPGRGWGNGGRYGRLPKLVILVVRLKFRDASGDQINIITSTGKVLARRNLR